MLMKIDIKIKYYFIVIMNKKGEKEIEDESDNDISIENEEDEFYDDDIDGLSNDDDEDKTNKIFRPLENDEEQEDILQLDGDDEDYEIYLQKFDKNVKTQIITKHHPELISRNYDEVEKFTHITRDEKGNIIDEYHKTLNFLTKYEISRILGERTKQLTMGAEPLIQIKDYMDEYSIALQELKEKVIPFIIERPLPNGRTEFWKLKDLELLL